MKGMSGTRKAKSHTAYSGGNSTVATVTRNPRRHDWPPITAGSCVIRSKGMVRSSRPVCC